MIDKMLELKAYGKINLTLEVLGLREDGFHEIKSIMQTIDIFDVLYFEKIPENTIKLAGNSQEIPYDDSNLIVKAARLLKDRYQIKEGVSIYLEKRIPVEAGLAGGSSDCAATLKGLNQLWDLKLSTEKLMELGGILGSDIPYTILGGTALVEGRGEKVLKIKDISEREILVVKPDFGVSTKRVYEEVDKYDHSLFHDYSGKMIKSIDDGKNIDEYLYNDLQKATTDLYPEVNQIINLMKNESVIPLMSGSGPTCYCFGDNASIKKLYDIFKDMYKNVFRTKLKNI